MKFEIQIPKVEIHVPEQAISNWQVKKFKVNRQQAAYFNDTIERETPERKLKAGNYVGLYYCEPGRSGKCMMSNTPAEINDLMPFVSKAEGDVLVIGLGLGVTIQMLLDKPEIRTITVMEVNQTIIELTGKYYKQVAGDRLNIICDDAFKHESRITYDAVFIDIWENVCSDNLFQMEELTMKYSELSSVVMCWSERETFKLSKLGF